MVPEVRTVMTVGKWKVPINPRSTEPSQPLGESFCQTPLFGLFSAPKLVSFVNPPYRHGGATPSGVLATGPVRLSWQATRALIARPTVVPTSTRTLRPRTGQQVRHDGDCRG